MPDASDALGDRDRALLAFERQWDRWQGGKGEAIRAEFGITAARYYQLLSRLLDNPAAYAHDPLTLTRLRRRRDARTRRRVAGDLGTRPGT
jgi:hypothetical protein